MVEARETSRGKVRENLGFSASMNKIGLPTYLINDKDFLIVAASDIQVGHGLPLDSSYILEHLERFI